jgi:hypothetical protein
LIGGSFSTDAKNCPTTATPPSFLDPSVTLTSVSPTTPTTRALWAQGPLASRPRSPPPRVSPAWAGRRPRDAACAVQAQPRPRGRQARPRARGRAAGGAVLKCGAVRWALGPGNARLTHLSQSRGTPAHLRGTPRLESESDWFHRPETRRGCWRSGSCRPAAERRRMGSVTTATSPARVRDGTPARRPSGPAGPGAAARQLQRLVRRSNCSNVIAPGGSRTPGGTGRF